MMWSFIQLKMNFHIESIEDICIYFFEVNAKYISSNVLKTLEFSLVHSTNENSDVFNSRDKIYLIFTEKKVNFLFFLLFLGYIQCLTH